MQMTTEEFLHRSNVLNYLRLLSSAPDEMRRIMLLRLLAEEAASARRHGWLALVD